MRTKLVAIGNSTGVRIPRALLEESGLEGEVELTAKKGEIKIARVKPEERRVASEVYVLSLSGLGDWNTPEEDEAWAHLQ
jgi:antitoxin component of MazEF toxin-antitoxin module